MPEIYQNSGQLAQAKGLLDQRDLIAAITRKLQRLNPPEADELGKLLSKRLWYPLAGLTILTGHDLTSPLEQDFLAHFSKALNVKLDQEQKAGPEASRKPINPNFTWQATCCHDLNQEVNWVFTRLAQQNLDSSQRVLCLIPDVYLYKDALKLNSLRNELQVGYDLPLYLTETNLGQTFLKMIKLGAGGWAQEIVMDLLAAPYFSEYQPGGSSWVLERLAALDPEQEAWFAFLEKAEGERKYPWSKVKKFMEMVDGYLGSFPRQACFGDYLSFLSNEVLPLFTIKRKKELLQNSFLQRDLLVWNKLGELLLELKFCWEALELGAEPIAAKEFYQNLLYIFQETEIREQKPANFQIVVKELNALIELENGSWDYLYVLGLAEGIWPRKRSNSWLFTEELLYPPVWAKFMLLPLPIPQTLWKEIRLLSEKFTAAQKEAITSKAKNIIVIAGAGSGKTRVLTERYKNILTGFQVKPTNVLAITFTNQATEEMKERIGCLSEAEITTFHSLAVKILREQALERGIHPQFSVLDESMAKVSIWKIIEKLLQKDSLGELYQAEELLDLYLQIMAKGFGVEKLQKETTVAKGHICRYLNEAREKTEHCFTDLEESAQSLKRNSKTQVKIQFLLSNKNKIMALVNQLPFETEDVWLKLTSYFQELKRLQSPVKEQVDKLKEQIENCLLLTYEEQDGPKLAEIILFLTRVEKEYFYFKTTNQLLDFWELEKQTLQLLKSNSQVRNYYKKQYPFILVDEFQDTNKMQKEILSLLAGQNLFLVGDPRQAIYRFREGNYSLEPFQHKNFQVIKLEENYRSHQQVLDSVNGIFRLIGAEKFGKLIPGALEKEQGIVRLVQLEKGRNKGEEIVAEATATAQIIENENIDDCAILLQTSSHIPTFAQVLKARGISVKVIGEQYFFNSAVVWSLNSFLKLIMQPTNQLAWYEVLQSFFSLGNHELNMIKRPKNFISFFSKQKRGDYVAALGSKGVEALDLVQKFKTMSRRIPTMELVLMWLQETEYWQKISGEEEIIVANWLEKVKYMERELGWSKREILNYFEEAEQLGCKDKELKGESTKGIVISTIHQAKGLEYPVIFLADLQRRVPPITKKFIISQKGILAKKFLNAEGEWQGGYSFKKFTGIEWEQSKEEKWRLFYVALTRTKEKLYIIGCGNSFNSINSLHEQTSWWGLLQKVRADLLTGKIQDEKLSALVLPTEIEQEQVRRRNFFGESSYLQEEREVSKNAKAHIIKKKETSLNLYLNNPWTVSSLTDLAICRKKFYYRYLLNLPELKKPQKNSLNSTLYGSFVHKVLENWNSSF